MIRRGARILLPLLLIASMAYTTANAVTVLRTPVAQRLVDRGADQIDAAMEKLTLGAATQAVIEDRLRANLDAEPRNWVVIESLVDLAGERGLAVRPSLVAEIDAARDTDHGFLVSSLKCAECTVNADACDLSAALICRAVVDITVLGDIRGVIVEGGNYALGAEVDEIDLTLSTIGLGATVLTPMTLGTSLTVKAGAGLAKTARRVGSLSPGLTGLIRKAAREGIDWTRLAARGDEGFLTALKASVRPDALRPVMQVADNLGDLRRSTGNLQSLHLMRIVDTPDDARRLARVGRVTGSRTAGLLDIVGKNRLLRATVRWSDEILASIHGAIVTLAALIGMAASGMGSMSLRRMRRAAH